MLIKTLTLHSLTYLVGIASSVAVHQVIASDTAARFDTGTTAIINQQIVNRQIKSNRLPIDKQSLKLMTKHLYRCQHKSRQIQNSRPIVSRQLISLGAALQTLE